MTPTVAAEETVAVSEAWKIRCVALGVHVNFKVIGGMNKNSGCIPPAAAQTFAVSVVAMEVFATQATKENLLNWSRDDM